MSFAFAVNDVRALRTDELGALAMINDALPAPGDEYLAALRAYAVRPLLWSRRDNAIVDLNGQRG
jgi:hypothetical protein